MEPDGKVFISLLSSYHRRQPTKARVTEWSSTMGVDKGVVVAFATSEGDLLDRQMRTKGEAEHLRRLEKKRERQRLARKAENKGRKAKGLEALRGKSKNQEKTEAQIAGMHGRCRRRRKDFTEQVSTSFARGHRATVWAHLPVKAMTASAKGTVEEPGKNVAAKAGLNRSILDKGWAEAERRTGEKVLRHGHLSLEVPAPYTSVTCPVPECGYVDSSNRATRGLFVCQRCGHTAHADINAAVEIRSRGMELVLAGGTPVTASLGANQGPQQCGAEPSELSWLGSRNQETGTSTVKGAA
jgi:putative transposase